MILFDLLKSFSLEKGAFSANVIKVNQVEFDTNFREMCKSNYCGMYGKCHMCPPNIGTPAELILKFKEYNYALVFQTITELEDSYDYDEMLNAKRTIHQIILQLRELFENSNIDDILCLGPGGCGICKECSLLQNKPCRFPKRAIHSLEAYCVDVYKLANIAGMKYVNGKDTVTYFAAILFKGDFNE